MTVQHVLDGVAFNVTQVAFASLAHVRCVYTNIIHVVLTVASTSL